MNPEDVASLLYYQEYISQRLVELTGHIADIYGLLIFFAVVLLCWLVYKFFNVFF